MDAPSVHPGGSAPLLPAQILHGEVHALPKQHGRIGGNRPVQPDSAHRAEDCRCCGERTDTEYCNGYDQIIHMIFMSNIVINEEGGHFRRWCDLQ